MQLEANSMLNLAMQLAHELGCAMEMNLTPEEIASDVWAEAIDGLMQTRHLLLENNAPVPTVIDSVLRTAHGP